MDYKALNIDTYNKSAAQLAEYFKGIGPRVRDIEKGLSLAGSPSKISVVEIGCGDGRDAQEIIKRVVSYIGVDPSDKLLEIARKNIPNGNFVCADALAFDYPKNIDIIFAFASLLHVSKLELPLVFKKIHEALRTGGILYLSLKERDHYEEELKNDEYGSRMFYYYNIEVIKKLAGEKFEETYQDHQTIGSTNWFTLALRKI